MSEEIHYPTGYCFDDIIGWGSFGMVCHVEGTDTVVKSPHDKDNEAALEVERKIYERLEENGGHKSILRYHEPYESGIRLEYACNGTIRSFMARSDTNVSSDQRLEWAEHIAEALGFVHSHDIIHGDLTCGNVLLDSHLQAKLCDFGGSSLNGSDLLVETSASHLFPGESLCVRADVSALRSTIYEIMTGRQPYNELYEEEIKRYYEKGEYPDTHMLGPIGNIVTHCWSDESYHSVDAAKDINGMYI